MLAGVRSYPTWGRTSFGSGRALEVRRELPMKLVPKLAIALLAGVFVVVAAFTAFRVRNEIATFDADVRRDQRIVGLTAAAALAKTRTREDAIRLARRVDATREHIRIRFVSFAPTPDPTLAPLVHRNPSDVLAPGAWVQLVSKISDSSSDADHLITYVGAPVVDETLGAIQLDQSLAPRGTYIMRGVWSVLTSTVTMLLVCGVIVALIGAKVVGQPVSELISAARRIGEGNFAVLGPVNRADEFGELARALRSMSGDLAAARERMEAEAEARIRALEQLRHAERLATLGQLASVLAHEIGTPLNVIAGHSKMIATGRLQGSGAQESASAIGTQCDRMTGIVRRILDYARRRPPRRTQIDAAVVMRQACELLSGLAQQRQVSLSFEAPEGDMRLFADPDQLQQAITNLVLNAIQASAPGQQITLRAHTTTDAHELSTSDSFVVFTVEDHGQGISEEARSRIFEPFFTTKPPGEGTGLGLSVVRDIVQEHGGVVEVSSHVGEGATFSLHLPRDSSHAGTSTHR